MLRIRRLGAGDTSSYILRDLHDELRELSGQRRGLRSGSTYEDGDRRQAITDRMLAVRQEIAEEQRRQEETIARTEVICIEQDRETGRLIDDGR